MVQFKIKGAVVPVFTPTNEDYSINYELIPSYASYLNSNGIKAVLVGGTTGEVSCLNVLERKNLANRWVLEARQHQLKVIIQVGGAPLPDVIELASHAETIQADAILTLPELYFKPKTSEQLVGYLKMVSEAAPSLPLLYYHFPMMSGVHVNAKEFFQLACSRIPNFKGMKADLSIALEVDEYLTEDRRVFIGNHLIAPAAIFGQVNSIATVTNFTSKLIQDILNAIANSQVQLARASQEELCQLVEVISRDGEWVPCMKWAMELATGLKMGPPRPPLTKLSDEQKNRIQDKLKLICDRYDIIVSNVCEKVGS